jgi:hypothetical protein
MKIFEMLGTNRSGRACQFYQRHGYVDMYVWATALARWGMTHQPSRLSAK